MEEQVRQRLTGAAVLTVLAVIFIPMVLDTSDYDSLPFLSESPPKPVRSVPERLDIAPAPAVAVTQPANAVITPDQSVVPGSSPTNSPVLPKAGSWIVQVASFREVAKATDLRDRLRRSGLPAFTEDAKADGRVVHRVRVGPDLSRTRAEEMLARVRKETGLSGNLLKHGQ